MQTGADKFIGRGDHFRDCVCACLYFNVLKGDGTDGLSVEMEGRGRFAFEKKMSERVVCCNP